MLSFKENASFLKILSFRLLGLSKKSLCVVEKLLFCWILLLYILASQMRMYHLICSLRCQLFNLKVYTRPEKYLPIIILLSGGQGLILVDN